MTSGFGSRKALSPVAAALMLIVITVAVSIIIAAWMGSLTFTFMREGKPYLDLQVSPPGYPEIGGLWSLLVHKVNFGERATLHEYAENATVKVDVLTNTNAAETYVLLVDDKGRASFQYLKRYSEVCFQAFLEGYEDSNRIVLNQSYVSVDTLTWLSSFSLVCLGLAAVGADYIGEKRKSSFIRILNWTFLCIMSISSFILVSTTYSFLFKGTLWGFPSEIIATVVTVETLKYSAFFTVLLYIFSTFLFYLDRTKKKKNDHKPAKRYKRKSKKRKLLQKRVLNNPKSS